MSNTRPLPKKQNWLIKRLQQLTNNQYPSDDGICYGLAMIASQDLLAGEDINKFNEILFAINDIPLNDFKNVIDSAHSKYMEMVKDAKAEATRDLKNKTESDNYAKQLQVLTREYINNKLQTLTTEEKIHLKIRALNESIELNHLPFNHMDVFANKYFQQYDLEPLSITSSKKIKAKGGIVQLAPFSGFYDIQDLTIFLTALKNTFLTQKINFPVSLSLSNLGHTINLNFIPNQGMILIDAENLPAQIINDPKELAQKIMSGFGGKTATAFSTRVYVTQDNATACDVAMKTLKQSTDWKNLHEVTQVKINKCDTYNATWLMIAADSKDEATFQTLLEKGANPNCVDINGTTPLFLASSRGKLNLVKELLASGVNINEHHRGQTALYAAAATNNHELIDFLLEHNADPNIADNLLYFPLVAAAINGNIDIVKRLIHANANLGTPGINALFTASWNGHFNVVKTLIENGVNFNARIDGKTSLIAACRNKHIDVAKLLLEKGANPNLNDNYGLSPLLYAASNNNLPIIESLIKVGAHINHSDNQGRTAFYIACASNNLAVVKSLIANCADVNKKTNENLTPFWVAVSNDRSEMVKTLLNAGADPNIQRNDGRSPLMIATQLGYTTIVKQLIASNAEINAITPSGVTALMIAAFNGRVEIVKTLIEHGADINMKLDGCTVRDIAAENGNPDVLSEIDKAMNALDKSNKKPSPISIPEEKPSNLIQDKEYANRKMADKVELKVETQNIENSFTSLEEQKKQVQLDQEISAEEETNKNQLAEFLNITKHLAEELNKKINLYLDKISHLADDRYINAKDMFKACKNLHLAALELRRTFNPGKPDYIKSLIDLQKSLERAYKVISEPENTKARKDLFNHALEIPGKSSHWDKFRTTVVKLANTFIKTLTFGYIATFFSKQYSKPYTKETYDLYRSTGAFNKESHSKTKTSKNEAAVSEFDIQDSAKTLRI